MLWRGAKLSVINFNSIYSKTVVDFITITPYFRRLREMGDVLCVSIKVDIRISQYIRHHLNSYSKQNQLPELRGPTDMKFISNSYQKVSDQI